MAQCCTQVSTILSPCFALTLNWVTIQTRISKKEVNSGWFVGSQAGCRVFSSTGGDLWEAGNGGGWGSRLRGLRAWVEQLSIQQLWNYDPRPRDPYCANQLCPQSGLGTNGEMARGVIATHKISYESVFLWSLDKCIVLDCPFFWGGGLTTQFQRHSWELLASYKESARNVLI